MLRSKNYFRVSLNSLKNCWGVKMGVFSGKLKGPAPDFGHVCGKPFKKEIGDRTLIFLKLIGNN
jgi:hypothetical protein